MNPDVPDFRSLWQQQKVALPDMKTLLLKLESFRKAQLRRLVLTNILFLLTAAFVLFIWYYYQPQLVSTKLGIVLVVLAMAIFIFPGNKTFSVLNKLEEAQTNQEYLRHLVQLKKKQKQLHTTLLSLYFLLLSLGIGLYMYEYTLKMETVWAVLAYAMTGTWILLNCFYIRPKTIQKQQMKLQELIRKFESVESQLESAEAHS